MHSIAIGLFLFILTAAIRAGGMLLTLGRFNTLSAMGVNSMFIVSILEVSAWALIYVVTGAIEGVEKALYFSAVTFNTLGYGDIVPGEKWRLLAGFEAANGIIMFGWSTAAIVIATVQSLYAAGKRAR